MARLSKQQVMEIISKAPPGTSPEGVVAALRESGNELEGYSQTAAPLPPPATVVPEGPSWEPAARALLHGLPMAGAAAGTIIGAGGGAAAGAPVGGVGAIPGGIAGGSAGLVAGAGAGRALENLGLHLLGLQAEPGFLNKVTGTDPNSPAGQTVNVIQEMATTAAFAKGGDILAGNRPQLGPTVQTLARQANSPAGKLARRIAGHKILGPLYGVLEAVGTRLKPVKAPEQLGEQLAKDPMFTSLGESIGGPEFAARMGTGRPIGSAPPPSPFAGVVEAEKQAARAARPRPRWAAAQTAERPPVQSTEPIKPPPFSRPTRMAPQPKQVTLQPISAPGTKVTIGQAVKKVGMASENVDEALAQSLDLERQMSEAGMDAAQKAVVRRTLRLGLKTKPLAMGNITRGMPRPIGIGPQE